jgi:hypothetical protein
MNRVQLLSFLPSGATVAEIGVYQGGFANAIRRHAAPAKFHLIDPWAIDEGDPYDVYMRGNREKMHRAYDQILRLFGDDAATGRAEIHRTYSTLAAPGFPDGYFDWIYLDAMHDYDNVLADLRAYADKVKPEGFILGHDFSNTKMGRTKQFGVVRAVREFVATSDFDLILMTNEAAPSYLLARSDNTTIRPALIDALLNHPTYRLVEIDESLLDQYDQVGISLADGKKGQLIRFGRYQEPKADAADASYWINAAFLCDRYDVEGGMASFHNVTDRVPVEGAQARVALQAVVAITVGSHRGEITLDLLGHSPTMPLGSMIGEVKPPTKIATASGQLIVWLVVFELTTDEFGPYRFDVLLNGQLVSRIALKVEQARRPRTPSSDNAPEPSGDGNSRLSGEDSPARLGADPSGGQRPVADSPHDVRGAVTDLRHLSPRDFSFYGFGRRMRDVERSLSMIGVRCGEPKVELVDGGVLVPTTSVQQKGSHRYHGGILDREGQPVEAAHLRRSGVTMVGGLPGPAAVTPACDIDEEVVYLGWLQSHHYGLTLVETLMRTWFLCEVDPAVRVAFNLTMRELPTGTYRRLLDIFDIPPERMLVPDVPTRFRRILVPEPLHELYYGGHERAAEPFRAAAARIVDASGEAPSEQPVYLSRGRLTSDRRIIVGEAELEELLRQNGFLVVYPETMTLDEQVLLFNRHTDIFACVGSAAHTVLFALNAPYLHLLTAGTPMPEFFLVPALAGARVTFVSCLGEESDHTFPRFLSLPTLVDYLDNRGFLTK